MESLLSLSFDNIACNEPGKIRKGLRQLEGLLAQICLSRSNDAPSSQVDRRRSVAPTNDNDAPPKELAQLGEDPAFRAFFQLQEGFQWNVALRLIGCLERFLGRASTGQNDLLIVSTLDLLHGVLLLHPPSRALFAREIYMNLLLDLLDPTLCPAVHGGALLALVAALLGRPANARLFEALDGLLCVTALCKSRAAARDVRVKAVEFLYFYLMPEAPNSPPGTVAGGGGSAVGLMRRRSVLGPPGPAGAGGGAEEGEVRSTEEKQRMLGQYLGNVEDLVEDLRERMPFGSF